MPSNDALLLVFLLLAAAATGWWFGRYGRKKYRQLIDATRPALSKDYLRGLNHLVNNEADKAIEVFVRLMEVDSETVETHLALGGLFRKRGEVDRALRIHQNLIARPNLDRQTRSNAMLELAKDYMKAGVLDRAESLFLELFDQRDYAKQSLQSLLTIYEREQDWEQAITLCGRANRVSAAALRQRVAHYHCELADQAYAQGDEQTYQRHLKRAMAVDERIIRVYWTYGMRAYSDEDFAAAIRYFRRVLDRRPTMAPIIIVPLMNSYEHGGKRIELINLLEQLLKVYDGVAPALALAELAFEKGDLDAAQRYLIGHLERFPDAHALGRVLYSVLTVEPEVDSEKILGRVRDALRDVIDRAPAFQCRQCGYELQQLHWRCPSCEQWDTMTPHEHYVDGTLRTIAP